MRQFSVQVNSSALATLAESALNHRKLYVEDGNTLNPENQKIDHMEKRRSDRPIMEFTSD
jgi:hypothetical protein